MDITFRTQTHISWFRIRNVREVYLIDKGQTLEGKDIDEHVTIANNLIYQVNGASVIIPAGIL